MLSITSDNRYKNVRNGCSINNNLQNVDGLYQCWPIELQQNYNAGTNVSYICDFKLSSSHIFQKKLISVMYFTSPNIPKILCEHSSFNVKLKLLILHCVHAKSSQSRVYFTVQHTSLNSDWPHFKCSVQLGHISSGYQLGSAHLLSQKVKIDLREERTFEPSLEGQVGF